jgi:hypothetical protein
MFRQDDAGWSNPRVLAVLAVVFLCGAAIGSTVTSHYLHSRFAASARSLDMQQLRAELALTPQQEKIVTKELDEYAKYYQNIEDEREDVAEHGKQRILDVLNPEQKKRFNEIFPQFPH